MSPRRVPFVGAASFFLASCFLLGTSAADTVRSSRSGEGKDSISLVLMEIHERRWSDEACFDVCDYRLLSDCVNNLWATPFPAADISSAGALESFPFIFFPFFLHFALLQARILIAVASACELNRSRESAIDEIRFFFQVVLPLVPLDLVEHRTSRPPATAPLASSSALWEKRLALLSLDSLQTASAWPEFRGMHSYAEVELLQGKDITYRSPILVLGKQVLGRKNALVYLQKCVSAAQLHGRDETTAKTFSTGLVSPCVLGGCSYKNLVCNDCRFLHILWSFWCFYLSAVVISFFSLVWMFALFLTLYHFPANFFLCKYTYTYISSLWCYTYPHCDASCKQLLNYQSNKHCDKLFDCMPRSCLWCTKSLLSCFSRRKFNSFFLEK